MDPKQNSSQPLDPKLQEVYDRVMGTSTAGAPTTPTPTTQEPVLPAEPTQPAPMPQIDPAQNPATPVPPTTPQEPTQEPAPQLPPMPIIDIPGTMQGTIQNPASQSPASPNTMQEPTATPISTPQPKVDELPLAPTPPVPAAPENVMPNAPAQPPAPSMPMTTDDSQIGNSTTVSVGDAPTNSPQDSMSATMSMPHMDHHDSVTVKIGAGGSPVAAAVKPKGKGISPLILIFGAFAFLVVYAVFWVRFFGYSLPFIAK